MGLRERRLPEVFLEAAKMHQRGSTAAATCGSLAEWATMPAAPSAISTTCGSSIRPRNCGRGWAEVRCRAAHSPVSTARWVPLRPETCREAAAAPPVGLTTRAISGYSAAVATIPRAPMAPSTMFGNSILPRTNGHGWAEATLSGCRGSMAPWERLRLGIFPEHGLTR